MRSWKVSLASRVGKITETKSNKPTWWAVVRPVSLGCPRPLPKKMDETKKPHLRPRLGEHELHLVVELTSEIPWDFLGSHPSHLMIPYRLLQVQVRFAIGTY